MDLNVLVLDDSYQHRYIKPGFNILLTDYSDPFLKTLYFLPEIYANPEVVIEEPT